MILSRRHAMVLTLVAGIVPAQAWAHREAATHTDIVIGDNGQVDITHRYHMHDAAQALASAGVIAKPELTSLTARAQLALYTEAHFTLSIDGNYLPSTLLGADYTGRNIYVYQQAKLDKRPDRLTIACDLLRDLIPGQINHVDVRMNGDIQSLRFSGSDTTQNIILSR